MTLPRHLLQDDPKVEPRPARVLTDEEAQMLDRMNGMNQAVARAMRAALRGDWHAADAARLNRRMLRITVRLSPTGMKNTGRRIY